MKKTALIAVLLSAVFLVSCGEDDPLRSPSANEVSRDASEAVSEETSGEISGITLPDDIF